MDELTSYTVEFQIGVQVILHATDADDAVKRVAGMKLQDMFTESTIGNEIRSDHGYRVKETEQLCGKDITQ